MASVVSVYSSNIGNIITLNLYWNDLPKIKNIGIDILHNGNYYIVLLYEAKSSSVDMITSMDFTTEQEARDYIAKALHFFVEDNATIDKVVSLLKVTTNINKAKLPKYPTILDKIGLK